MSLNDLNKRWDDKIVEYLFNTVLRLEITALSYIVCPKNQKCRNNM